MLEAIEAWLGFVLVLIFLGFILATLFMWVGIKAAGIENISVKTIILMAITTSVFIYILTIAFSALPFLGTIPSYFIGLLLSVFVIKVILGLTLQQSLVIWIFNIAAQVLVVFFCTKLFIGGLKDLIKII